MPCSGPHPVPGDPRRCTHRPLPNHTSSHSTHAPQTLGFSSWSTPTPFFLISHCQLLSARSSFATCSQRVYTIRVILTTQFPMPAACFTALLSRLPPRLGLRRFLRALLTCIARRSTHAPTPPRPNPASRSPRQSIRLRIPRSKRPQSPPLPQAASTAPQTPPKCAPICLKSFWKKLLLRARPPFPRPRPTPRASALSPSAPPV